MSEHEKCAWASLAASVLVWAFFAMRMTEDGLLAVRQPGIGLKDERDLAIEARADRIEGYVLAIAINALLIQALADAAFAGHSMPRIDLGSLPTLVFALLTTLFVGHGVKQAVMIWSYRT